MPIELNCSVGIVANTGLYRCNILESIHIMSQYQELFNMLREAAFKLKYPKFRFSCKNEQSVSESISFTLMPKGYISIKSDGVYIGKITSPDASSVTLYGYPMNSNVRGNIEAFAQHPKSEASLYGQRYGHCCFCNTQITSPISLRNGYGPICAENYSLPYSIPEDLQDTTSQPKSISEILEGL